MAKDNKSIIIRFAIVYFIIVFAFLMVVFKLFSTQNKEKESWLKLSDSIRKVNAKIEIEPNRGNIYSCDGKLMASTVPYYYLFIDFRTKALHEDGGKLFKENIDSLSYYLSSKFNDKSQAEYKQYLENGFRQNRSRYPLNRQKISHSDYKEIKQFPLFEKGTRSGLIAEEQVKRIKPYGSLAAVTIGDLYGTKGKGARQGIEAAFDSLLRGTPGIGHLERKAGAPIQIADVEPINGVDIITTIDVEMQDIAEKALLKKLKELSAEFGCVVLMEVKTGQIKACVNLTKAEDSNYIETENNVLRGGFEPGSTFKIPAMMAALEDGIVKPNDTINCGNGTWQFNKDIKIEDHNTGEQANGKIPASEAIIRSSNVAMAKIIYNGYKDNPQRYVETLKRMGVGCPMKLEFLNTAKASIQGPQNKSGWSPFDLASMGYGYSVKMPMLYTLAFYNAIANNGKMIRPYFVKSINKNGSIIKEFEPEILRTSICSQYTLDAIKSMMLQVVEAKEHATGKPVRSDFVRIAGKTGTARYDYPANTKYQVSFCGFYPYENPTYTCIVFIRNPIGNPGGGYMAGPVFKEIAERVMARNYNISTDDYKIDSLRPLLPNIKNGYYDDTRRILSDLGIKSTGEKSINGWSKITNANGEILFSELKYNSQLVPNVSGMGAKDAVYLMEKAGLRVQLLGKGKVYIQSIGAGKKIIKGQTVTLVLN